MVLRHFKIIYGIVLLLMGSGMGLSFTFEVGNRGFLNESELIIKSLREALKYFEKEPEVVTDDVVLGLFIAIANLQWIVKRLKENIGIEQQLKQLLNQSYHIIAFHKTENALLKDNLWENDAEDLKYGFLSRTDDDFFLPEFDSCEAIDVYMMKGTPEDSDFCLNELISSKCGVSEYCWLSEVNGDFHSGYKTSHRLLYFQFANKVKCDIINPKKFSSINALKKKLCQQMLLEAMALFKSPTFFLTQDLFMEQIALCGLEGYVEFADGIWRNRVRSWQNESGCFGKNMNFKNCTGHRMKRTDFVSGDCHNHVTAVAVSALAFFLRTTLKMAFSLA